MQNFVTATVLQEQLNDIAFLTNNPIRAASDEIFRQIAEQKHITDSQLASLYHLYPGIFEKALDLADTSAVTKFVCGTKILFQVTGSAGFPYICFEDYCSCPAFANSSIMHSDLICCKHQLAVAVVKALNTATPVQVAEEQFTQLACVDRNRKVVAAMTPNKGFR